jgi:hypothetical protein
MGVVARRCMGDSLLYGRQFKGLSKCGLKLDLNVFQLGIDTVMGIFASFFGGNDRNKPDNKLFFLSVSAGGGLFLLKSLEMSRNEDDLRFSFARISSLEPRSLFAESKDRIDLGCVQATLKDNSTIISTLNFNIEDRLGCKND